MFGKFKRRSRPSSCVSATELASMGNCERRAVLDALYGKRASQTTRQARVRGDRIHEQHDRDVRRYARQPAPASTDRRCFVATAVFGPDAPETDRLRRWRDQALLTNAPGRLLVAAYYRVSPALVVVLASFPPALGWVRAVLRRWIRRLDS